MFTVGLRSCPSFADHGFQDLAVLPGAFYIDTALTLYREQFQCAPGVVRNVSFPHPIVLAAEDAVIRVDVRENPSGLVEYEFYESGAENEDAPQTPRRHAARLEIDRTAATFGAAEVPARSIEALQADAQTVIDAGLFYRRLAENGNQYGPAFQTVAMIWRTRNETLAKVSTVRPHGAGESHTNVCLLDSVAQLVAPFVMDQGETFVLKSIEALEVRDTAFPETLWGLAVLRETHQTGCVADVRLFDTRGRTYVELTRVGLTLLERARQAVETTATTLAIAANFTVEPLEPSLRFWSDFFAVPTRLEFAPFGQIFQQLLDPGSLLRRNRDGINVLALGLEEWAVAEPNSVPAPHLARAERAFEDRDIYRLPNGLEIVHVNAYETDYLYKEIFEDRCYLKHGISLHDGDTVVDIGANIGLFSLFVMSRCTDARIYAYEPAPLVHELLTANCHAYGTHVTAVNAGVSDRPGHAPFTFYQHSSVFSSFHPDEGDDRAAVSEVVRNTLRRRAALDEDTLDACVRELTTERLDPTTHDCRLTSVSEIIREHQIDTINLLKIDAEKSELDILDGIEEGDWAKIDQIVVEIHDPTRAAVTRIEDLLTRRGYSCCVEQPELLEHSGLFNLYATRRQGRGEVYIDARSIALRRNTQDFCAALRSFANQTAAPLILCLCPRTPAAHADASLAAALDDAEHAILNEARAIPHVRAISSGSLLAWHPGADYYDPYGHQAGHIPYTPAGYAAIGTAVVRAIVGLTNPFKVIVLDCDNTLWQGICGEDGPSGIAITEPHRQLQQFMLDQMHRGMLLCLCSKNNERDVLDVFEQRSDMVLTLEQLAARRINWNSKSENIRSLARELNVGLDSFVLVDDNPVDCADVRINCPGVLTLQLPAAIESIGAFLSHSWAFDRPATTTREDHTRTRMYQESAAREQFREAAPCLTDFIIGLRLRIDIAEPTDADISRVSQLTFRTNQFNLTTIRRTEREIVEFLQRADTACRVIRVADRFGDYGLVGIVMYEIRSDRYLVDTLLLSCRVLGRGIEHALVSHLGRLAIEQRKSFVEMAYRPTGKNAPALEFLNRLGARYRNETGTSWTLPAEALTAVTYVPDEPRLSTPAAMPAIVSEIPSVRAAFGRGTVEWRERLRRIAEQLGTVGDVVQAIEEHRLQNQPLGAAEGGRPGTPLQAALLRIWRQVLGRPGIGVDDNFFEAGGTSLNAVQIIAAVKRELNRTLSIVTLFECPTVSLLAARLSVSAGESHTPTVASSALLRGQQRRQRAVRPHAS